MNTLTLELLESYIEAYLLSRETAWADSTKASERHRLRSVAALVATGSPEILWSGISHLAPYSRLTCFIRVVCFIDWVIGKGFLSGPNQFQAWKEENARVFKHCYRPRKPGLTFQKAQGRIQGIQDSEVRLVATEILNHGLRASEPGNINLSGEIIGKGGKARPYFSNNSRLEHGPTGVSYQRLRRALAKVGLKPHDLRKIFLTRLVDMGANQYELCEIAGWNNINTASSYIKVNRNRCEELVNKVRAA